MKMQFCCYMMLWQSVKRHLLCGGGGNKLLWKVAAYLLGDTVSYARRIEIWESCWLIVWVCHLAWCTVDCSSTSAVFPVAANCLFDWTCLYFKMGHVYFYNGLSIVSCVVPFKTVVVSVLFPASWGTTRLHGVMSHKNAIFVVTTIEISYLTLILLCAKNQLC
jgi:hypothetical protein